MRPVNLLPARYRPRTGGSGDSRSSYIALGALALLVLAVFGYVVSANQVSARNSEIAAVRQQITQAETQSVTLQGYGDFAGVKDARLAAVKSLATQRIDWERIFRELAHVLPERVWLTGFDAQAGAADGGGDIAPMLVLTGCAESHSRVADAMVRMRELHVAEDVELTQTAAGEDEDEAAGSSGGSSESACGGFYSFGVEVMMATPAPAPVDAEPDTVPASLGGGE
ncbi:MAG TPA: PilN domain-containing protein [Thermoleophilaceae bacterium]|nr:PilN domain-containing protein [Thermoleophilaceae bacterium]